MKPSAVLIMLFALAGCSSGQKVENCWSPETNQTTTSIIKEIATEYIEGLAKASERAPLSAEKKQRISDSTKITMSDLHVVNRNQDVDRLTCGATVHFSFARADNTSISGDTSVEFDVYKGEHGYLYSVAKAPIVAMVNSASE